MEGAGRTLRGTKTWKVRTFASLTVSCSVLSAHSVLLTESPFGLEIFVCFKCSFYRNASQSNAAACEDSRFLLPPEVEHRLSLMSYIKTSAARKQVCYHVSMGGTHPHPPHSRTERSPKGGCCSIPSSITAVREARSVPKTDVSGRGSLQSVTMRGSAISRA